MDKDEKIAAASDQVAKIEEEAIVTFHSVGFPGIDSQEELYGHIIQEILNKEGLFLFFQVLFNKHISTKTRRACNMQCLSNLFKQQNFSFFAFSFLF